MNGREVGVTLHAEQAVPFASRRNACARHLELMERLEKHWRLLPSTGVRGTDSADFWQECREHLDKCAVWVEEAQRWLDAS